MTYNREIMCDGMAFLDKNVTNDDKDSNECDPKPGG
jgi:hypothetical protein